MAYELVIFDNDGTLVESETTAHTVLSGYLTELGLDVIGYTALMPADRLAQAGATALIAELRHVLDHL
ncbi:phosphoglycolate phosphatase-like HAD superfamily hydrolase [Streptacidiphilus sp. MAP12-33]